MGTQGMAVLTEGGEVVLKAVCGVDGYNAPALAKALEREWPCSLERAYFLAHTHDFGGHHDRVIMGKDGEVFKGDGELDPRYRRTFGDPHFNPRWESGFFEELEVREVGKPPCRPPGPAL